MQTSTQCTNYPNYSTVLKMLSDFFPYLTRFLKKNVLFAEKQIYNNNQQINILLIEKDHNPLQEIRVPTMKFKLDVQRKGKT